MARFLHFAASLISVGGFALTIVLFAQEIRV